MCFFLSFFDCRRYVNKQKYTILERGCDSSPFLRNCWNFSRYASAYHWILHVYSIQTAIYAFIFQRTNNNKRLENICFLLYQTWNIISSATSPLKTLWNSVASQFCPVLIQQRWQFILLNEYKPEIRRCPSPSPKSQCLQLGEESRTEPSYHLKRASFFSSFF